VFEPKTREALDELRKMLANRFARGPRASSTPITPITPSDPPLN
jgi:hypothetical protein